MPPFYVPARVGFVNDFENGCDIARQGAPAGAASADEAGTPSRGQVGVGPWPGGEAAWPVGERYDPELLRMGDRRNVEDRYRYWTMEAIRADVAARALPFEVAVENLDHDFNIGSIVRTANALGARRVHVVGRKRWNRRGAMVTDRYLPVDHRAQVSELVEHCAREGLSLVGVDNVEGSVALEGAALPRRACLVFGSEASGLSEEDHRGDHPAGVDALHERRPRRRHRHVGARLAPQYPLQHLTPPPHRHARPATSAQAS